MTSRSILDNSLARWALVFPGATAGGLIADGLIHFANRDLPFISDILGGVAFHGVFVWLGFELAPPSTRALPAIAVVSVVLAAALTAGTILFAPSTPAWADYAIGFGRLTGAGLAFGLLRRAPSS